MAPKYPDKRSQFRNLNPSDFVPGTPKASNAHQIGNNRTETARRSEIAPSKAFRVTTAPKPLETPPEPVSIPMIQPPPIDEEIGAPSIMAVQDEKELE